MEYTLDLSSGMLGVLQQLPEHCHNCDLKDRQSPPSKQSKQEVNQVCAAGRIICEAQEAVKSHQKRLYIGRVLPDYAEGCVVYANLRRRHEQLTRTFPVPSACHNRLP